MMCNTTKTVIYIYLLNYKHYLIFKRIITINVFDLDDKFSFMSIIISIFIINGIMYEYYK